MDHFHFLLRLVHSEIESRLTVAVAHGGVRARLEQKLDERRVALPSSDVEGRVAIRSASTRVSTMLNEKLRSGHTRTVSRWC